MGSKPSTLLGEGTEGWTLKPDLLRAGAGGGGGDRRLLSKLVSASVMKEEGEEEKAIALFAVEAYCGSGGKGIHLLVIPKVSPELEYEVQVSEDPVAIALMNIYGSAT